MDYPVFGAAVLRPRADATAASYWEWPRAELIARILPTKAKAETTAERLERSGFRVEAVTDTTVSFSGSADLFRTEFDVRLESRSVVFAKHKDGRSRKLRYVTASPTTFNSHSLEPSCECVHLLSPAFPLHEHTPPPSVRRYYTLLPDVDLPKLLGAKALHDVGTKGRGIRVSMIDSGFVTRVQERILLGRADTLQTDHRVLKLERVTLATASPRRGAYNYAAGARVRGRQILINSGGTPAGTPFRVTYHCLHPYYEKRRYRVNDFRAVSGLDALYDSEGHGTAMAANLAAIAPEATFSFVRHYGTSIASGSYVSLPLIGFQLARNHQSPAVISCSWSVKAVTWALKAEIAAAVAKGTVVVFAGGNGQVDGQGRGREVVAHPSAITVGGSYPLTNGGHQASNYASSFVSRRHSQPPRRVPDVVGVMGKKPAGTLIVMPTQPGGSEDVSRYGTPTPRYDGTKKTDGWIVASGTSATAQQVAGVVALLREARPSLRPDEIRNVLENSALDVDSGRSYHGDRATKGWDPATGFGLVQADAAIKYLLKDKFAPFIRVAVKDGGEEPRSGRTWRRSPDVVLRQSSLATPSVELGHAVKYSDALSQQLVRGSTSYVYVRVQNRGVKKGHAKVHVLMSHEQTGGSLALSRLGVIDEAALRPGELRVAGPVVWSVPAASAASGRLGVVAAVTYQGRNLPDLAAINTARKLIDVIRANRSVAWKQL